MNTVKVETRSAMLPVFTAERIPSGMAMLYVIRTASEFSVIVSGMRSRILSHTSR